MLGVTAFGLFLTPVFYTVVERVAARFAAHKPATAPPSVPAPAEGH